MKNIDHLPKEEQIEKLKKDSKSTLIAGSILGPLLIALSVFLITL